MTVRRVAKLVGTFHNLSYYAPEMKAFADVGLPEYWRAYMAYRSAPMGMVPASVVQAVFYNFAPARVAEGLPSAWETTTPTDALALRDECIQSSLHRILGADAPRAADRIASTAITAIEQVDAGMRPLFAAHRELPAPTDPLMRLWWACTLWREYRGDGHNIALAAASIDSIECHLLLAAKGVGSKEIITKIRGWANDQWDQAHARLAARDLMTGDGEFTDAGQALRAEIENHTDRLAMAPIEALGDAATEEFLTTLEPLVGQLIESGTVPGRWPPPKPPS